MILQWLTTKKSPSEELIISWPVHQVTLFSEEMMQSSFFECFQIVMFLRYFFVTTSSVFCFLFFFKGQSKIGVRIIHGRALYKGKYGKYMVDVFRIDYYQFFNAVYLNNNWEGTNPTLNRLKLWTCTEWIQCAEYLKQNQEK